MEFPQNRGSVVNLAVYEAQLHRVRGGGAGAGIAGAKLAWTGVGAAGVAACCLPGPTSWVAAKELQFSYHNRDTQQIIRFLDYGNLINVP